MLLISKKFNNSERMQITLKKKTNNAAQNLNNDKNPKKNE